MTTKSPASTWTTSGTQILKNGTAVFLKGVCYSPTPVGGATFEPGVGDWFTGPWSGIWERDFPKMKAAGIDNIRTYFTWAWTPPKDMTKWKTVTSATPTFDQTAFLDAAEANGISVTMGIALDGGNIFDNVVPKLGKDYFDFYKLTVKQLAISYGNHPAVMGFCIANEQNNEERIKTAVFWNDLEEIAKEVKTNAPDKLVMMAMQNESGMYQTSIADDKGKNGLNKTVPERYSEIFDVWGVNIYSGMENSLKEYKNDVASTSYACPLIVSEWGIPAANTSGELTNAEFTESIANVMNPRGKAMKDNVAFVAGAQYFEWTDEWWKEHNKKTPWLHILPVSNTWTEQWFGLHSIAPCAERTGKDGPWNVKSNVAYPPDIITARPTLDALTTIYAGITPSS